jgi:RNA-directed DNA polymerase
MGLGGSDGVDDTNAGSPGNRGERRTLVQSDGPVYAPATLAAAWKRVRSNRGAAGVDRQSVERFERHAPKYLDELHRELREGRYRPSAVRRQWIPKPGNAQGRPLDIPTVRDRIVQSALRHVLEPIWEVKFADQSYGFRPGRSCKDALRRVDELLRAGFTWVVEADIQSYLDASSHCTSI